MEQFENVANELKYMHKLMSSRNMDECIEKYNELYGKIQFVNLKRDYAADFKKYVSLGIKPNIFVSSIIPVFLGCRKAACFFSDHLRQDSFEGLLILLNSLKEDYNINLDILRVPHEGGLFCIIFLFKEQENYEKLKQLRDYINEYDKNEKNPPIICDSNYIKSIGNILGYPPCCLDFFTNSRISGEMAEAKCYSALSQILKT